MNLGIAKYLAQSFLWGMSLGGGMATGALLVIRVDEMIRDAKEKKAGEIETPENDNK